MLVIAADKKIHWPLIIDILKTSGWNALGRAAGFLVPVFIALWFGISHIMDTFFLAYSLVLFLSSILTTTITTVIVPYIAEARSKNENPGTLIGSLCLFCTLFLLAAAFILNLLIRPLADWITPFSAESLNLLGLVYLEMTPLLLLLVYSSILDGALNAYKKFALPAFSPVFRACVNILLIFLLKAQWGVHAIILGYIAGEIIRILVLWLELMRRKLFRIEFTWKYSHALTAFLKKAFFQISGMVLVSLNLFIDKTMAAWLEPGSVTILYYGDRLYTIPAAFAVSGLMVALLSHWSEQYYSAKRSNFAGHVHKTALITSLVSLVPVLVLLLVSTPLVEFLFGLGIIDNTYTTEISRVFSCYMAGFIPYLISQVYARGHIVQKNTRPFLHSGIIMFAGNILLNLFLMQYLGAAGLALSTSIINIFCCLYLGFAFACNNRKTRPPVNIKE